MPAAEINLHPAVLRLVEQIAQRPEVRRILLHGSRARGDHRPRSDYDLAIDAPDLDLRAWFDLLDLAEAAETLHHSDMVKLDEAPPSLRTVITEEGITLYEQKRNTAQA